MSFRLRVLVLVVFLVATSVAVTAWLTASLASRQLNESVTASQRDVATAADEFARYGQTHGTWDAVDTTVRELSQRLHQRIRVVAESGTVLADSDLLAGHAARPVIGAPTVVDVRPPLPRLDAPNAKSRYWLAAAVADRYRTGWAFAACLTTAGVGVRLDSAEAVRLNDADWVRVGDSASGLSFDAVGGSAGAVDACQRSAAAVPTQDVHTAETWQRQCESQQDERTCEQESFTKQVSEFAPASVRLYLGARDEPQLHLSSGSLALAAAVVMLAAALTALLLTRRVVRPISALTAASRRLGAGDLAGRVPVRGRDELAELGRAFNRMAQSLAQSEQRQRQLVADVAHELRTPLANLRGYLEALADGVLAPDPELFTSLHEEALLQQRIVDDLQDLALAEAGTLAYHKTVVDLAELAETCRTMHATAADAAGIALSVDVVRTGQVYADPDRLRQVLGNLIRNALAATARGGSTTVIIERRAGETGDNAGDRGVIRVRDTGRGIAEKDLPHVFDRLWRADTSRGRGTGGSGLGLAISRQIVADHGGTIEVASRLNAGTTFTVVLPAAAVSFDAGVPRR